MNYLKSIHCLCLCIYSFIAYSQLESKGHFDSIQQYPGENSSSQEELFIQDFFSAPLPKFSYLRYPAIENRQSLYNHINRFKINLSHIEIAFNRIKILDASFEDNILLLVYQYNQKTDTVFAYYKSAIEEKNKRNGIQIIPGSGLNQSSAIYYDEKNNYQRNIDDISQLYGDVYILVKPNEDFLAIHNGKKKLSEIAYINYLINLGGSYSAYYFIQSLVLSKYIKYQYEQLYLCGLSQGGLVALLNSLQSFPQKVIVASGYSILMDEAFLSSQDQFILPGFSSIYTAEGIKMQMQDLNTEFLFTWGVQETGLYGLEAKEHMTAKFFSHLPNVRSYIHPKAHYYIETIVKEFLEK